MEVERNVKNCIIKDYVRTTISKCIDEYKHKHSEETKYRGSIFKRKKYFKTQKEAQKFVDLVLLENKKPQIYNSFTPKASQ